jgi:ABC-type Fe3+-hydroxamate transport system substrate-binding protein
MHRSHSRLSRRNTLALSLGAALAGRSARAGRPAIADGLGRVVSLNGPAERIVIDFNYEEFTAVAGPSGWDRVVGFDRTQWADNRAGSFKRYLGPIPRLATLPDIGNTEINSFSMERVLSLRPDLVILGYWSFVALAQQVRQMESLGIPVLVVDYNAEIPERHVASTLALGSATGNEDRARTLAALYAGKIAAVARRVAEVPVRPNVYVEFGQGGADVVGNSYWKGMWGRLLEFAGAGNIAAGHLAGAGAWGPLDPEYVLAANPDAVFIAGSSWVGRSQAVLTGFDADIATTRARLAPYARRQGWDGLKAVQAGQVFAIEHGLCRALLDFTATQFIAKSIFPDRFADLDPVAEMRRYHEQFLPVPFEGTWMARLTPAGA